MPKWPNLDDFCSMYEFMTLTDKELEFKRIGYKNINLPDLCGNGDIESFGRRKIWRIRLSTYCLLCK